MPHARFEDVELAYEVAGAAGSPVLLIMGFSVPGRAWSGQVPALAERHRVAWFDNRGVGNTQARPGWYSMRLLADDARRLLDHLDWPTAHIVGVSMGGMIAQELAVTVPDRVRSLTLIATHAGGVRARTPTWRGLMRFAGVTLGRRGRRIHHLEHLLYPIEYLASTDRAALRHRLVTEFGVTVPPRYRLSQLAAIARHDTRGRLGTLTDVPTLVVKPTHDVLVHPRESDALHRLIPNAQLLVFEGAGHGLVRQEAERLNAALLDHFAAADA